MQREIKFRAWDKDKKEMIFDGCKFELISLNLKNNAKNYKHIGIMTPTPRQYERFDIQQYTGLKDKNGKEIYEGDIVKLPADLYHQTQTFGIVKHKELIGAVIFENGKFMIDTTKYWEEWNHFGSRQDIDYMYSKQEVIGNKYENPELLKV